MEPAQFRLQPLSSKTSLLVRTQDSGSDATENHREDLSLASHRSYSDNPETPTRHTGLLIRGATGEPSATNVKVHTGDSREWHNNTFMIWTLELLLLILALGLMGAMVAILQTYSGAELPTWNGGRSGGITLNALIGLIATALRAILAFLAFEVLADLKWDWVAARFRPLRDVQRFEDASRGAWGSIMLVPLISLRQPLTAVAVIVAVASVAIGPFTQQTMQTYYCLRDVSGRPATIRVAHRVEMESAEMESPFFYSQRPSYSTLHVGIQAAMQDAMVNPSNDTNIAALFNCPSGNCTFPTYPDRLGQPLDERASYASLGMCSRCEDVYKLASTVRQDGQIFVRLPISEMSRNSPSRTDELQVSPGDPTGPNTTYLDATVTGNLTWAHKAVPQDFLDVATWSAANFSLLALSQNRCSTSPSGNVSCPLSTDPNEKDTEAWGAPTDFIAAACTLYPCVKYYRGVVRNGALSESVVRSTPLRRDNAHIFQYGVHYGVKTPCWVNGTLYTASNISSASENLPSSSKQTVPVSLKYWPHEGPDTSIEYANITAPRDCVLSVYERFLDAIQVELAGNFGATCQPRGHQISTVTCVNKEGGQSIPMAGLLHPFTTSVDTIRENIESLSMRLTTEIRRAGSGPYSVSQVAAEGQASENRTCLRVAWGWFALPGTLLVLCVVLLGGIIVRDLRARDDSMVWKGSVLPFLLKDHVADLETTSLKKLSMAAERFEMKLQKVE